MDVSIWSINQISFYSVLIFLLQKHSHELTFMKNAEYPTVPKIVGSFSGFLNLI